MCNVLNAKNGGAGTWPVLMPGDVTLDCVGKPDGLQMPLTLQLYHAGSGSLPAQFSLLLDAKGHHLASFCAVFLDLCVVLRSIVTLNPLR